MSRSDSGAPEQRAHFGLRFVASVIDIALSFAVPCYAFSYIARFLPDSWGNIWIFAGAASVVAYSVVTVKRGHSPGLNAEHLAIVVARTGRPPDLVRSLLLGIERLIGAVAGLGTVIALLSGSAPSSARLLDVAMSRTCMVLFTISVLGRLWMLVDRSHATLFDRMLGLAVIRNAPVVVPSPSTTG